jgi:hypothetical protein
MPVTESTMMHPDPDTFGTWMANNCDLGEFGAMDDLYSSYVAWCDRWGETSYTRRRFADEFEHLGFPRERRARVNGFVGLQLRAKPHSESGES